MINLDKASGIAWRVLTQDCAGGKALNTVVNLFCAGVLIWGAPKAWDLYWELRAEVAGIRESRIADTPRDDQRDKSLAEHGVMLIDHERRISRIEGREH